MNYEVIPKSWSKRRKLDTPRTVTNIQFLDFTKKHNHFCKMQVTYGDGSVETLISRVIYNPLNQGWVVDGMRVAVRLLN